MILITGNLIQNLFIIFCNKEVYVKWLSQPMKIWQELWIEIPTPHNQKTLPCSYPTMEASYSNTFFFL